MSITNLRYADDITLLATSSNEMKNMLQRLKIESAKAGLSLNTRKTKVMLTGTPEDLVIDGEKIEQVDRFTFLGSEIDKTAPSAPEIKKRLAMGRTAVSKLTIV